MTSSDQILQRYVVQGRHTADEVTAMVAHTRSSLSSETPLSDREWLSVSVPGAALTRLGRDVVLGVRGGTLDDQALRKIATACPNVWMDARWYPADVQGVHMVLAGTLTVFDPDGIGEDVAALLDVPADDARFEGRGTADADPEPVRYVRIRWTH